MKISVILCTHNPRLDYLARVLDGLRAQTAPVADWELLLVDNASTNPVSRLIDLTWHPAARVVVEPTLGLTPARLRGMAESTGDLIVFVDDDTVLDPAYLKEAWWIAENRPFLGAWNGSVIGVFEKPPSAEIEPFIWMLTLGEVDRERWSNLGVAGATLDTLPSGAGLCVRRGVAQHYALQTSNDPLRQSLGRRGADLIGSEDRDLSATSLTLGLGTGKFPRLRLDHLIPARRLEPAYLIRLAEASEYGETILCFLHRLSWHTPPSSRTRRWLAAWERLHLPPFARAMRDARLRGHARAEAMIRSLPAGTTAGKT